MKTTIQHPNALSLFVSANFDKNRIVIAEHEFTATGLNLWLEDNRNPVTDLEEAVQVEVPLAQFEAIITKNELNSYAATLFTERGHAYEGRTTIADPIDWFEQDASKYERDYALDIIKNTLLSH